jgi:hypothetical protein
MARELLSPRLFLKINHAHAGETDPQIAAQGTKSS